jgi:hypothetical protein
MSGPDLRAHRRPPVAAALLERELGAFRGDLTTADAAARTGLALVDAEGGLRVLASRRGGHLKATDAGEIIYSFPDGLVRPPEESRARRLLRRAGRVLASVGRLVVRAWVSVVLVGYAALFVVVAIALASRDDDGDGIGGAIALVGRVLVDALYWTFHPFSPVSMALAPMWLDSAPRRAPRVPFYERVNRFVFGPARPVEDLQARERALLAEIRRLAGRVGPSDVMRVTGADRQAAERELLRLIVEYEGDVHAADGEGAGAVIYSFKGMRATAAALPAMGGQAGRAVAPVWNRSVSVPPLSGNGSGTNLLLGALNGFNLVAGGAAVASGLTLDRLGEIIAHAQAQAAMGGVLPPLPPAHGVPLLLGWIPLVFSAALFALPLGRALRKRRETARAAAENGRRALLRLVHEGLAAGDAEIRAADARRAWVAAVANTGTGAGGRVRTREIEEAVRALGGEIDVTDDGAVIYRFDTAAREERALAAARAAAGRDEASPGRVVFASSAPGAGDLE